MFAVTEIFSVKKLNEFVEIKKKVISLETEYEKVSQLWSASYNIICHQQLRLDQAFYIYIFLHISLIITQMFSVAAIFRKY